MGLFEDLGKPEDIDATVRLRLAHILNQADDYLDVDASRFEAGLGQIRKNRQVPGVFARYYDLVSAVTSNQFTLANRLIAEIVELAGQPAEFAIIPYSLEHLGDDYDRFPRLLFAEYTGVNPMASPPGTAYSNAAHQLLQAMDTILQVDKSIHDEICGLLLRIYITIASKDRSARSFAGVTSFMVWGASFINVDLYKTQWEAVQFLVHEITHSVLFGLSCDEPLVLNDPADSYCSPLRTEGRPMDGIYHAMLVCARVATINQHGRLSEQGRHLFDHSCRALSVAA